MPSGPVRAEIFVVLPAKKNSKPRQERHHLKMSFLWSFFLQAYVKDQTSEANGPSASAKTTAQRSRVRILAKEVKEVSSSLPLNKISKSHPFPCLKPFYRNALPSRAQGHDSTHDSCIGIAITARADRFCQGAFEITRVVGGYPDA